jgi:hypothetical protein
LEVHVYGSKDLSGKNLSHKIKEKQIEGILFFTPGGPTFPTLTHNKFPFSLREKIEVNFGGNLSQRRGREEVYIYTKYRL